MAGSGHDPAIKDYVVLLFAAIFVLKEAEEAAIW